MTDHSTDAAAPARPATPPRRRHNAARPARPAPADARPPRVNPVLEQLATLYPKLFGEVFLPLKRGIFQDLMAAHPEVLEQESLKAALAQHTRSSRYLTVVASGQQRHDLQGEAVEHMAPEHVYHALLEVFRRRHQRTQEDVRPKLRNRMMQAFEASGMSSEAYAALVRSRDEAANALLDEALAEATARAAREEALLRAFDTSGQTLEVFADMYGMDPRQAGPMLERARHRKSIASTAQNGTGVESGSVPG